jgi:hypothetical protein
MQAKLIYTRQKEVFQLVVLSVWQPLSMLARQRIRDVALGKLQTRDAQYFSQAERNRANLEKDIVFNICLCRIDDTFFPFSFLSGPLPPPPLFVLLLTSPFMILALIALGLLEVAHATSFLSASCDPLIANAISCDSTGKVPNWYAHVCIVLWDYT